jgi:hypothetical protein
VPYLGRAVLRNSNSEKTARNGKRSRLRFSLRGLLLVVFLVALGFGWWACNRARDRQEHAELVWTTGVQSASLRRWRLVSKDESPATISFCVIRANYETRDQLQLLCSGSSNRKDTEKARHQHDLGLEFRDANGNVSVEVVQQTEGGRRKMGIWRLSEGRVPSNGLAVAIPLSRTKIRLGEWRPALTIKWMDQRKPRDQQFHQAVLCIRVSQSGKSK